MELEKALEQFFTPWAWRWEIEYLSTLDKMPSSGIHDEGFNFADYLGLPHHPSLAPELSSIEAHIILQDLEATIDGPTPAALICLKPPSLLHFPNSRRPSLSPILRRYLITRFGHTATVKEWIQRSTSLTKSATKAEVAPPSATDSISASYMLSMPKISMSELGAATAGVVNPRKWGWPGYLSLARSSTSSRKASPVRSENVNSERSATIKASGGGTVLEPIVVGSLPESSALERDLTSAVESSLKRSLSATNLRSPDLSRSSKKVDPSEGEIDQVGQPLDLDDKVKDASTQTVSQTNEVGPLEDTKPPTSELGPEIGSVPPDIDGNTKYRAPLSCLMIRREFEIHRDNRNLYGRQNI